LELELLEARNLLSFTNILVNNPAEDMANYFGHTNLDTQNESALVLGANSNVVVAYNDDGILTYPNPVNPTNSGYSLSTNGGASFTDEGSSPASSPYWPSADPALARSSKTGTIFLSTPTLSINTVATANGLGERVNISRSVDNGQTFAAPINGTPGFFPGVDG